MRQRGGAAWSDGFTHDAERGDCVTAPTFGKRQSAGAELARTMLAQS